MEGNNLLDNPKLYQKSFLLLLVISISVMFLALVRSFVVTILLAAIFSGLMSPLYRRLLGATRGRRALSSALTVLVLVLLVIVPMMALLTIVVGEAIGITHAVGPWIQEQVRNPDAFVEKLEGLPGFDRVAPYRTQILTKLGQLVGSLGNFMVSLLSSATKGTVSFLFHGFLLLYAMFFFLLDGDKLIEKIIYYSPLPREAEKRMIDKFVSVSRATIKGTLVIGVVQGALAGAALALAGIPSAVFWGTVMVVLSIIPGIGTGLVWLPAAIFLAATGRWVPAVVLTAWCALVVGSVDNVLRPRLVGRDTQMHDLLVLFSTLGGLLLFGFVGVIIGPIVAALLVTIWDLYGVVFRDLLLEGGSSSKAQAE